MAETNFDLDNAPLDRINPSDPSLFEQDAHWPLFKRLREEAPVHYCAQSDFGPFWSITALPGHHGD